MGYVNWILDKIADRASDWVLGLVGGFVLIRTRSRLLPVWRSMLGWWQSRRGTASLGTDAPYVRERPASWLDALGPWLLVLAIVVLTIWNQSLKHHIHTLNVEMYRYVSPRQLTKDQIDKFGKYLREHSQPHEVRIKYILGDSEAQSYASDWAAAFKEGNWLPTWMPVNPASVKCNPSSQGADSEFTCSSELQSVINDLVGLSIQQSGPNPPQPVTIEEKLNPPKWLNTIVSEAAKAAGLEGVVSGYGNNDDPMNTVTVVVGARSRAKWAMLPPGFTSRLARPSGDITDDDFP